MQFGHPAADLAQPRSFAPKTGLSLEKKKTQAKQHIMAMMIPWRDSVGLRRIAGGAGQLLIRTSLTARASQVSLQKSQRSLQFDLVPAGKEFNLGSLGNSQLHIAAFDSGVFIGHPFVDSHTV